MINLKNKTPTQKKLLHFTLIEVVIAIAILGVGLGAIFSLSSSTLIRFEEAQSRWARQHLMNNVCEFYLLCGDKGSMPSGLIPNGFSANCQMEIYENVPEGVTAEFAFEDSYNSWYLGRYIISLRDNAGRSIGENIIEKIMRDPNEE